MKHDVEQQAIEVAEAYHTWLHGTRLKHSTPELARFIARALLEAHQSGRREGMEWQPIETAPKDGTECIFYSKKHGRVVGFIPTGMAHYKRPEAVVKTLFHRRAQGFRPTHWMPLPDFPASIRAKMEEQP